MTTPFRPNYIPDTQIATTFRFSLVFFSRCRLEHCPATLRLEELRLIKTRREWLVIVPDGYHRKPNRRVFNVSFFRRSRLAPSFDTFGHYTSVERGQFYLRTPLPPNVQSVRKVSLQFQKLITKANEETDKWKLLQNETYTFKFCTITHLYDLTFTQKRCSSLQLVRQLA